MNGPKIIHPCSRKAVSVFFAACSIIVTSYAISLDGLHSMNSVFSKNIVGGCEEFARENDKNLAIAVVDSGGHLLAFSRMDSVPPGVGKIALWKAISAALYGMPTKTFQNLAKEDQFMFHLPNAAPVGGGEPVLLADGQVSGGVGVSGASAELDAECARAGLAHALANK